MREPFSRILPKDERLLAAAECDLSVTTGPLAGLAEMLALFSPVLSIILAVKLHPWQAKLVGALLPPLIMILLARYPLRRWKRARQRVGVSDQAVLIWRRPAALRAEPRIDEVPLSAITGVELEQDDWDRHAGTQQVILHLTGSDRTRDLGRLRDAERLRDAIVTAVPSASQAAVSEHRAPPGDFLPPPSAPGDYRP